MKGSFKLTKSNQGIAVLGLEFDNYLYTTNLVRYAYQFTDAVTYNVLYKVNTKDQTTENVLEAKDLVKHLTITDHGVLHCHDVSVFKPEKDGLYKVVHIIIPTKDWLLNYISAFGKDILFDVYKVVYFTDGELIYKYTRNIHEIIDFEEITEVNVEGTTLCRSELLTFCTDKLEYCYYKLACALLDDICPLDECDENKGDWYTLQLILIERYVIQFLLDLNRYLEAEEILQGLSGCAGPCYNILNNNSTLLNINKSNCGCSM